MWYCKMYFPGRHEVIESDSFGTQGAPSQRKVFPFLESLLSFTELDIGKIAIALRCMLCCDIPEGALYYGEIRRRERVSFTPELRAGVRELLAEMHELYRRGYTPKVKPTKSCNACSLKELCLPKLMKSRAVSAYLRAAMEESP